MNRKSEKKDSGNFVVLMAVSCIFIILVVGLTLLIGFYANESKRGTFGDMFGFANALFTGLSFVSLIGTILLQRKDLNVQRNEL